MSPTLQNPSTQLDTSSVIRQIKRSLHTMMNGPVSASMRNMGLAYKVNFGVELPRLQEFAKTLPHTRSLAVELWKENIRECRLLAGMLMPPEECSCELAEIWVEQMRYAEEAECTVMHLFSRMKDASSMAFPWMASDKPLFAACGFMLIGRLLAKGAMMNERDAAEYLDHTAAALADENTIVRNAARNTLLKFMNQNEVQERMAEDMLSHTFPASNED